MNLKKTFFKIVIIVLLLFTSSSFLMAQKSESQLKDEIAQYEKELEKLSGQSKTLSNQIAQFDAQIKLTTLKIQDSEQKISLLGGRISEIEVSLDSLTTAFTSRAVETYKMSRFENGIFSILNTKSIDEAFSQFFYLKKIQESDRELMEKMQTAQTLYIAEKTDEEELRKNLEKQKKDLDSQKKAKASLLTATKNDEKKYQQLLSEARSQLAALKRFVVGQGGASILQNQTKCDSWGCYYNQRDSLWGNIGMGGSAYSMAEYGCLVSSVSMVASHYGKNIKPGDIAVSSTAFVPQTGYLYHSFNVNGVSVTLSTASKSLLDSELAAGRPVIAGLYSGPDHFIVIVKKEGDKYIMNDPFLENGSNRPLTDKYNVSDITSLRLVSFN